MKNEMIYPAIVIATYNRPHALSRLLNSIAVANYDGYNDIPLVISIDGEGSPQCEEIANNFIWTHGEKIIILHVQNLGLKRHILSCGDLTEKFGAIIMLEEDVLVSPYFYDYSVQTLTYYQDESRIAGVSLFFLKNSEMTQTPFWPMANGHDVFFAQVPSSWGQCWTKEQWGNFKNYFETNCDKELSSLLPPQVQNWPSESSWKKYFYSYMIEADLYFVIPYVSYATNMGDKGEHFSESTLMFQSPLMLYKKDLRLLPFSIGSILYDAYFEPLPEMIKNFGQLLDYNFEVDLAGAKPLSQIQTPYLLSIKETTKAIFSYDMSLTPVEMNVIQNIPGKYIHFARTEDFIDKKNDESFFRIMRSYNEICYNISNWKGYLEGIQRGVSSIQCSKDYQLGHFLLKPIRYVFKRRN